MDIDEVICELPEGYTFYFNRGDDMYVLSFGDQELGSFYHYSEMVDAAVNHKELIEWKSANSHLYI